MRGGPTGEPARTAGRTGAWSGSSSRATARLSPVDFRQLDLVGIQELGRAVVRPEVEVVGPGDERLELGTGVGQELGVYAEPRREREPTVHLVAVRADLGHRGLSAVHRHDALVAVVERLLSGATEATENVLRRPLAGLLGHAAQLG